MANGTGVPATRRRWLAGACLLVGLTVAAMWVPAIAGAAPQVSTEKAALLHGTPGFCAESGTGAAGGHVVAHRNDARGTVTIHVQIRDAIPGSTYFVAVTCVEAIGEITMNRNGSGHDTFTVPSSLVPSEFRVDLSRVVTHDDTFFTGLISLP
jgi:hypothetical protein